MILERLVLENFRQFKGRQEIVFADNRDRNVTIVHAENGFGKTTLLKSLLWALYGREGLKDDFEKPDKIINEGLTLGASDANNVVATVQITFKHGDLRYVLTRRQSLAQQNFDPKQTDLTLTVMKDGQSFNEPRPQQRLQTIVPIGISGFLFFNGERINYLAEEKNSAQVTDAIQQMLGLKLLRTTIDDLRHTNVRGKLRSEQRDATSDEKRSLIETLGTNEEHISELCERRSQALANLEALAAEMAMVENKLALNREARDLQAKRIRLLNERTELYNRREELVKRLSKLIADDGYTIFTGKLLERGRRLMAQLRSENKIPARVLNSFLQELIENSQCICMRSLAEGSDERNAVESLLTIAGDQDFNNAVGALDHAIGLLEGIAGQTEQQLKQLNIERLELGGEISRRNEEIEEIHQVLGGKKDDEVHQLEARRKQLEIDQSIQYLEKGRIENQIESAHSDAILLEKQIRDIEDLEEVAARAQRRVDAVDDCLKVLEEILNAEIEELRPILNDEIGNHFKKIIDRDYWAELTENYTLRIRKLVRNGENLESEEIDAALSTGQRTVTSLVFIASLVALANRRSEIRTILRDLAGSAYPVVIDSPFGSLSIFREGVARYIPELAPQVLLLVSPEQYNGQVEKALNESGRIGRRYYLTYHGRVGSSADNNDLVVNGHRIQQYFPSEFEEFTEVREFEI